MKIYSISFRIAASALIVFALANCAGVNYKESTVDIEETRVIITGSHIQSTDIEKIVSVEPLPAAPPQIDQTNPAAQTLQELLALVKADKIRQSHSNNIRIETFNSQRTTLTSKLSEKDKERLFNVIANSPEASGQIFKRYRVNPTIQTKHNPVSTFSMDVDNGSYKLASAMLRQNKLPNPDGIRIEEFVNSMQYQYNHNDQLFSISAEAMPSPFRQGYHILHLGLQTKILTDSERNPSNLVLVADVSGSMGSDNKLELLKNAMTTLVSQLNKDDHIAIVAYNDRASVILNPTKVSHKRKIFNKINKLRSGGSTNAEQGLIKGYQLAEKMFQPGFNNRIILTSDGMANVGATSPEVILARIAESKEKGIFLTTLGVGRSMFNDHLMEQLADQGNGNYLYIADQKDIQAAFVDELNSQLQTVAKDAKIQLKFNPDAVSNYRLLGYENRHLNQQDFTDAKKDGGEIGAGHKVTALYEIKIKPPSSIERSNSTINGLANIAVAYKKPQGNRVHLIDKTIPLHIVKSTVELATPDSRLSYAVAAFAEKLRQSYWARTYSYHQIERLLSGLPVTYQNQTQVKTLMELISTARRLDTRTDLFEPDYPLSQMNFDRVPLLD